MTEPNSTFENEASAQGASTSTPEARAHFAKAVEEARAGAQALGQQAKERGEAYVEKLNETRTGWTENARVKSDEARDRALAYATEGKAKATTAIGTLAKTVNDSAETVDERMGVKYGDYVRVAGRSLQDAADRLESTDLTKITDDTRAFVRSSPAMAVGIAAIGGFMLARLFQGPDRS